MLTLPKEQDIGSCNLASDYLGIAGQIATVIMYKYSISGEMLPEGALYHDVVRCPCIKRASTVILEPHPS